MSNIRLVKKNENHDNIRFGINQSYYNEVVRRLQNPNINETVELLNSGKYLDSKTLKKHKDRLEQYKSDFEYLNEIQKLTSNDYDESSYIESSKWLEDFTKTFNERESVFSKFKNEFEYNDAVKLGELYDMPSADILPYLDGSKTKAERDALVSKQKELENQLQELTKKLGASGNKGVGATKKASLNNELSKVKKQISDLDVKSQIAYTTSSGQNVTWKNLYDDKKYEEDFNELYQKYIASPDWTEKSAFVSQANRDGKNLEDFGEDLLLEYIHGDSDLRGKITAARYGKATAEANGEPGSRSLYDWANDGYDELTDKEKELITYLYYADKDALNDTLRFMDDKLVDRHNKTEVQRAYETAQKYPIGSSLLSVGYSLGSGIEFLTDTMTGDIEGGNQMAAISSSIRQGVSDKVDWEVGGWDVFDFLYNTGMSMTDSVVATSLLGGGGGIALGLSAAAQTTNDAINRGMSKGQAFTSGLAAGIFEGFFETWSFGAFKGLTKDLKRATFRDLAKYVGKNMWNNAKEELLTEIANISYDYFLNGGFSQVETSIRQYMNSGMSESEAKTQVAKELGLQVAEAAGSGALMGFGFGAGGSVAKAVNTYQEGKQIKDSGETRNLVDLGKSLGEGTDSYEFASKITDKSKAYAIGQLLGIAAEDIQNANRGDIVKSLERKGYDTEKANNIADLMLDPENTLFANSRGISAPGQTYNDIINNPNSTVNQRNEAYEGILRGVAKNRINKENGKNTKAESKPTKTAQTILPLSPNYVENRIEQLVASGIPIEQATQVAQREFTENQGKMSTQTEKAVESKFESNPEGKDFATESGKIIASKKLIASDKNNMAFEVTYDDGTTEKVDANDISFGNEGEALVYSAVMDMNVPVGVAETLIKGYKGNDVKSAGTYVNGMREAFVFGKYNQEADLNNGAYASQLTEEQRNNAFKLGKIYANEKAIEDTKAIVGEAKPNAIKKREGKLHFEGDKLSLTSVQDVSIENLKVLTMAIGKDIHIFESYVDKNGKRVYKDANGEIKPAPNGFYQQLDGSIWIDLNAGNSGQGTMLYTVAHELTHFIKQWSPTKFKALADFLVEQYGKEGVSVHQLVLAQQEKAKKNGREISYDVAFEEMVADSMETMLTDGKVIRELANKDKGLFDKIKSWIDNLLRRLTKEYKNYSPESTEGQMLREMKKTFEEAQRLFTDALVDASDNFAIKGTDKAFVENYLKTKDVVYNLRAAESHQDKLAENYTSDASIDLETLQKRYAKVIGIWEKLGGELNSKFLNEWNNKVGKDRAFTIFKAQAGYKYNVELSSMCKKGVPLFEAIDTIVKKEVMNELKTKTLGKAEKEILYDILKNHNFEIPCAICYVEQARQREGVIINDFLDGKIEKNAKGKVTKYKLGWNDVLNRVEKEMKKNGVDYTFRNVDKNIATDSYAPADIVMDEATQDAFYKALKKVANAEIVRWNREDRKSNQKERRQITDLKPQTIKEAFKGTLPSNLKIFKVLFNNPSSRFKISRDLLYSSATTLNLANSHNDLYSLFNSQGGVAGYKTKQAPIVYWGDILGKSWKPSTVRKEGGIRNQSNSDFQMYTLLDQAQMYIDFSAKGYYLQAYTKVLSELKLFGLSRGKINASLIPQVIEYKNADGSINWAKTMENAGLDENGNPIYDDFEGINHTEAFMLIEDAEYSKNICGICIGYSDNHIRKLLDDNRVQQIIGFHDKTDNPEKRYRGAKYSKNYNGLNEAVKVKADGTEETVHVGFNQFVSKAEKMFKFNKKTETFEGTVNHNGKEYSANDIPRLAADLYLEMCAEKNYRPAYNDFSSHKNYYKLLADFGLYDSQGNYAPHQKVQYNMPDKVPYLDKNGNKAYMPTEAYIKAELQKELTVRDSISEALADTSENGIIPQFVERVNALHTEKADTILNSDRDKAYMDAVNNGDMETAQRMVEEAARENGYNSPKLYHGTQSFGFTKIETVGVEEDALWSPFFATNKIDTAQTYSGASVTRNISDRYTFDSVDDLITDFVYMVNRTSGIYNFMGYDTTDFDEVIERVESGEVDAETEEMFNEVIDDIERSLYENASYYEEDLDEDTFYSSDEMLDFYKSVRELWEGLKAVAEKGDIKSGNYQFYADTNNLLVIDGQNNFWNRIPLGDIEENFNKWEGAEGLKRANTRDVSRFALENGYSGVKIKNIWDDGGRSKKSVSEPADVYIFFNPQEQVKSADTITYDDQGNVIPLSQRFNEENDDIRYSDRDSEGHKLSTEQSEYFKDSKIRDKKGRLLAVYHGTKSAGFTRFAKTDEIGYFFARSLKTAQTYSGDSKVIYAPDKNSPEISGAANYKSYLNIKKPYIIDGKGANWNGLESTGEQVELSIKSYKWSDDGKGLAKIQFKYGGKKHTQTVQNATEFENFIAKHLNPEMAQSFAFAMNSVVDENGKGEFSVPIAWDFKKNSYAEAKSTRDIVRRAYNSHWDYDGVIFKNVVDSGNGNNIKADDLYVAFYPNQIKSVNNTTPTTDADIRYSERVTDEETLDYLNEQIDNGEYITVYRSFQVIDGGLYAPMNAVDRDENGKSKKLGYRSELGVWEQATESPEIAQKYMDKHPNSKWAAFDLDGVDNKTNGVAYNPYLHASNLVLNDQFSAAYRRNLVTVECRVPKSEVGAYHAKYAKDTTGWVEWKPGGVAGKLMKVKPEYTRKLFVSRYMLPVRIVPDSEVAKMYKEYLDGTNISVPWNVVTPSLRKELVKVGVNISYKDVKGSNYTRVFSEIFPDDADESIRYSDRDTDSVSTRSLLANALEGAAQNDIEKNKLAQYKEKIALIEAEQKKLHELREKLFTKGISGAERRKIQDEATQTANRINTYDRQLFNLESTTALKNVLTREKELAKKRQKQKDNENLRAYKEKVAETTRELLKKNRESRQKAIEGRTKTEMRHKVKKVVNDLNQLLLNPTKERHIPEEMRIAVAEALALVNMDTVDADTRVARYNELIAKEKNPDVIASLTETRDRILEQGNKLGEKLAKLKDAYGMVRNSADDSLKSMYDDVIYNKIESVQKKVGKTPLRSMTLEQLESVYELYKMVLTTVRDSNKAFAENIKMTRQALGSNTFVEIKENNKSRDRIRFESIENFGWKNLKPMQAMKTIGSGILQKLWNNILYGQEVFAQDYDEAVKFAKEIKEKYGYNKWNLDKLYSFETKSGKVMKINLEQMMSVYAYSKRKQADEHIEFGGILLNESIIKEKKLGRTVEVKVNDSTAYRLDKRQVGEIITTLEKKFPGAISFVDEMQKYLSETMGEKGNEVSMKMYGIKLFKEEHYFPLKSSKDFMEAANAKLKGDVKIKNKGMTKSTVEHASNPIVLENFLDVWGNHINEMAMYHGLVLPLEDFSRTLNYGFKADDKLNTDAESVRTALRSAFGESADNYLNELLKAINGGVLHDSSTEFADRMISKFKKAKVMASLSVIVQQPTAIIRAMGIIEPKYFVAQNFHHKQTWEELKKYCPTAIIKETGSFDTNMGRTIVDMIKEDRTFTEKVGDTLGKAPAYMDEMGWNMIWRALKNKVATEQKLSGEELLKECGRQMTLIINETQVYDSVMSRNELMRSKSAFTKMATSFMAEPTTVANMIYGATLDFKRGKKSIAGKTVAAVISSVVINGLVSSLVYAFRDDDEEKTWLEKYLSSATTEVIDGFNPLTYIPYVKDAYSLFQGYDVERTDMAIIGDVVDAIEDFYNVLDPEAYEGMSSREIAKHIYENAKPLLTSICDMFGLPVGNILRDAEAIIVNDNLPMSKTSGEGIGLAAKEGWLNSSPKIVQKFVDDEKYHKLYLIANNGDTAYVKTEVNEMVANKVESGKTEKEAKTSVRSSFTGVYRDEYKKAYKNKDAEEMNRIRKFLYATGLWNSLSELDSLLAKWRTED